MLSLTWPGTVRPPRTHSMQLSGHPSPTQNPTAAVHRGCCRMPPHTTSLPRPPSPPLHPHPHPLPWQAATRAPTLPGQQRATAPSPPGTYLMGHLGKDADAILHKRSDKQASCDVGCVRGNLLGKALGHPQRLSRRVLHLLHPRKRPKGERTRRRHAVCRGRGRVGAAAWLSTATAGTHKQQTQQQWT